jgi:hypothetical protein
MHDPLSVAHELRWPIKRRPKNDSELRLYGKGWRKNRCVPRQPFLVIWHRDPEKDGSDDSCDWFHRKKYYPYFHERLNALDPSLKELFWLIEEACAPKRARWRHPRWHVWHWHIQIPAWQTLRRWLFSRCQGCGKHFTFGYSPVSTAWNSPRLRWFRSEQYVYHEDCCPAGKAGSEPKEGKISI